MKEADRLLVALRDGVAAIKKEPIACRALERCRQGLQKGW